MYENDPNVSTKELLKQIQSSCGENTGANIDNVALAMPAFSALLVKLSNEASATADKNIKIQNRMIALTSIILAISITQLFLAFPMLEPLGTKEAAIYIPDNITAPQSISPEKHTKPHIDEKVIHNALPNKKVSNKSLNQIGAKNAPLS